MDAMIMTVDKMFTINEVAEMLKISTRTVRRWIKKGQLRATPMPGRGRSGTEYRISLGAIKEAGFDVKEDDPSEGK